MKSKLAFIFAAPLLFCVLGFQGSCHSQCEELRQELIKDCLMILDQTVNDVVRIRRSFRKPVTTSRWSSST